MPYINYYIKKVFCFPEFLPKYSVGIAKKNIHKFVGTIEPQMLMLASSFYNH